LCKRKGIKIISVVDTNVNPDIVDYIVPANDDSISAVGYILDKVKETINNSKVLSAK
jgi:small subunit ribosomal protein S2